MLKNKNFPEQCELEIKRIELKSSSESVNKLKIKANGSLSKIDFIRIVDSLYEINAFVTQDGLYPDKKTVMQLFGNLVSLDLKSYDKDLTR